MKQTRRKQSETRKMPTVLSMADIDAIEVWPLGSVMTKKASGEYWTDVLLILVDEIRLGGKYNSRRVRYDGRFYITHNGRRVGFAGDVVERVADKASWVYGQDLEQDKAYNRTLKGY